MSQYVFSFICNVWMLYKREREIEKWGRGVNYEEEIKEKNEMGEGGCMRLVGEKKKERQGVTWVVGKKNGNKKEKRNGEWVLCV
jgi:hypothetical protein